MTREPEVVLNVRRLVVRTLVGVLLLVAVMAAVGMRFREPLTHFSRQLVESAGGPALAVGFMVPDATSLPIPQDAFSAFALLGGMPFWHIVAWASAGSLAGGSLGFAVCRHLRRTRRLQEQLARRGAQVHAVMERYGDLALALFALTPLPYSVGCWTCGALGMSYGRFLLISLLRIPRVAFYLWLIQLGLLSFT